jgi:hypothetical protein
MLSDLSARVCASVQWNLVNAAAACEACVISGVLRAAVHMYQWGVEKCF